MVGINRRTAVLSSPGFCCDGRLGFCYSRATVARFAAIYFLLFCSVGVYAPWLPPFLEQHRGLTASAIGLSLAVVSISRATLPPLWGWVLDRTGGHRLVLGGASLVAGFLLIGLLLPGPPGAVIPWMAVYGFFVVPVLPLLETLTMQGLGKETERYGSVRLWGSAGFIVTSFGLGWLLKASDITVVPLAAGLPFLAVSLLAVTMPRAPRVEHARHGRRHVPWRLLGPILFVTMLGQGSHGPYYVFFTLELTARGVHSGVIGALWALGVIAEICLLAFARHLLPRIGLVRGIRWALALAALRWLVLAVTDSLWLIAAVQLLHAVTYGLQHIATVKLVDDVTPDESKTLGQSVLNTTAYGVGVGGGLALAGVLIDSLQWAGLMGAAAAAAGLGWLVSMLAIHPERGVIAKS
jgi:PPP family 3-phenylpropionic acid transporter